MSHDPIAGFEALLAKGQDSALLRFSLGNAYVQAGRNREAAVHLQAAVDQDPNYSAAWKLLGRALAESDQSEAAEAAYTSGIAVAEARGDLQAAKEMKVFLRRLQKNR